VDLVLHPSAFPRGYADLEDRAQVVEIVDATDPSRAAEVVVADVKDIYTSKQAANRAKDRAALPKFVGIHHSPDERKEALRQRYRKGGHGSRGGS
jgi:hypothetical protein